MCTMHKDLLDIDAASNLMQGVMNGSLGGNEVELDVLEDAGITLELNSGDMNACMTTESSSKDTNVHGADIAPEPSAGDVDCGVLTRASCPADEPDQIVDGRYRSPTSRLLMMSQGLLLLLCSIETILLKIWRCELEASSQIRNNVAQVTCSFVFATE